MGWFSKKPSEAKVKGSEAGLLVLNQIQSEFTFSSHMENGNFRHPPGFLVDPYIVGFIHGYIIVLADVSSAARGRAWLQNEANEFVLSAVESALGANNISEFIKKPREYKNKDDYNFGYLAANTLVKALYAPSALDPEMPIIKEANKLVEERKDSVADLFSKSNNGEILAWAIKETTIKRHIEKNYLQ